MISKHDASFSEPIQPVERVCLWAAGVSRKIVLFLPSEKHIYVSIGAAVLLTAVLAGFTGFLSFKLVLGGGDDSATLSGAGVAAAFWALLIFNLDRSIVVNTEPFFKRRLELASWRSNRAQPGVVRDDAEADDDDGSAAYTGMKEVIESEFTIGKVVLLICRIALALLIAAVVSIPLELQLFNDAIQEAWQRAGPARIVAAEQAAKKEVTTLEAELDALKRAANDRTQSGIERAKAVKELGSVQPKDVPSNKTLEELTAKKKQQKEYRYGQESTKLSTKDRAYWKALADDLEAPIANLEKLLARQRKDEENVDLSRGNALTKASEVNFADENMEASDKKAVKEKTLALDEARSRQTSARAAALSAKPLLTDRITLLNSMENGVVRSATWFIRILIAMIEIIPIFLKVSSSAYLYHDLTVKVSALNGLLCTALVGQQSRATRKSFAAANNLRIRTIRDNQEDLVKAASEAIQDHIKKWRESPGTPIRDLHHQIRLTNDQMLPGSLSSASGAEEKTPLSSFIPGSEVFLAFIGTAFPASLMLAIYQGISKSGDPTQFGMILLAGGVAAILTWLDSTRRGLGGNAIGRTPGARRLVQCVTYVSMFALGLLICYWSLRGFQAAQPEVAAKLAPKKEALDFWGWATGALAAIVAMVVGISKLDEDKSA